MTANAIVAGTFADMRSVKSRSVVVLMIEVPIERANDVVAMFGFPQPGAEVPVAVARLVMEQPKVEPPKAAPKPADERTPWDALPKVQQAAIVCNDPEFWEWLHAQCPSARKIDANEAAEYVRFRCEVLSRKELDTDEAAATRWNELHGEFKRWRSDRVGQEQAEAQAREYGRR